MSETVRVIRAFVPKTKTQKETKILLFAHLELFNCLEVRNWRLLKTAGGLAVGYPTSAPAKDGTTYKQVIPRTESLQEEILKTLKHTYDGLVANEEVAKYETI